MQTIHFIKYISKPDTINLMSESDAVSLVKEFPYCQSGQVLLALHLNQTNHLLFEQQLKKSAIYSSDRKKLFDLISSTKEVVKTNLEIIGVVEEIKPIVTEPIIELPRKPTLIEKIAIIQKEEEVGPNEKEKLLELEYINQAISNSYTIETSDTIEEKTEELEIETINNFDETIEYTFSDWLKHLPSGNNKTTEQTIAKRNYKLDLIDKFIQEDPKIKPKKTEFYSPINMARLSVVDDSNLVSETLALIQVEQGNYEEALKTYHKLSLKIPEKRSYFAIQIKILNQKIK